jgi:alpha-tubulin suppressor-like RCC1 family protein
MLVPIYRYGVIASSYPRGIAGGGPPSGTLYTMYVVGDNYSGSFGDGVAINLREPVISYDSGATGVTYFAITSSSTYRAVSYIDSSKKLYAMGNNIIMWGQGNPAANDATTAYKQIGSNTDWAQVEAGGSHFLALTTGGTLYGWGINSNGQLGDGSTTARYAPVQIGSDTWTKVACGTIHSLGIKSNGTLWAWGNNANGRLGDGTTTQRTSPVQIGVATDWVDISAGVEHSHGIRYDGSTRKLWGWGNNGSGRLGDGTTTQRTSPVQIGVATDWSKVQCKRYNTFGIKTGGSLWGWGINSYYNIGDGTQTQRNSPVQIGSATDWIDISKGAPDETYSEITHFIKSDGSVYVVGYLDISGMRGIYDEVYVDYPGYTAPKKLPSLSNISKISTGNRYTYYLDDSTDKLKFSGAIHQNAPGYGTNFYGASFGQEYNPTNKNWKYVSIGHASNESDLGGGSNVGGPAVFAIDDNNELWAWGENRTPSTNYLLLDCAIFLGTTSAAVQNVTPTKIGSSTWSKVEAGLNHVLAIKTNGTLWSWGQNDNGQLGIGSTTDQREPVQIGSDTDWAEISCGKSTSYAIKTNGTLWAWGLNGNGQLGDGTTTQRTSPVQIGSDTNWSKISAGLRHCIALKTTGTLWGWGQNTLGTVGDNTTTQRTSPVQVGSDTNWSKISAGSFHNLAVKTTGTLWGWGSNEFGALGDGTETQRNSPVQVGSDTNWIDTTAGRGMRSFSKFYYSYRYAQTSYGVKSTGTLWTWGFGYYNGNNFSNDYYTSPQQVGTSTYWTVAPKSSAAGPYDSGKLRIGLRQQ